MRHTVDVSPESQLLAPARARFDSWERAGIPTGSFRMPWRLLAPSPHAEFPVDAAMGVVLFTSFLGARMQHSLHPWKQYEFAHAMWCARNDSASLDSSAAALLSFRGGPFSVWDSNVRQV